jgi:hypothetical protein
MYFPKPNSTPVWNWFAFSMSSQDFFNEITKRSLIIQIVYSKYQDQVIHQVTITILNTLFSTPKLVLIFKKLNTFWLSINDSLDTIHDVW